MATRLNAQLFNMDIIKNLPLQHAGSDMTIPNTKSMLIVSVNSCTDVKPEDKSILW